MKTSMTDKEALEKLVEQVRKSAKYRHLSPDLIRRIGVRELAVRRNQKEAVKATKNKLHQVGGAYQERKIDFDRMIAQLAAAKDDPAILRQTCREIMSLHSSTRERLPILDEFYTTIFAQLPPITTVVDVACGLNPLALPWMPLHPDVTYYAYDIYEDMMGFLADFLQMVGVNGRAQTRDVIGNPPTEPCDLALVLKTLPCLEQVDKSAATQLLDAINAQYILITYPAQSLGGRNKGMAEHYTAHFKSLINGRNRPYQRFEFQTELAFLVQQEVA